VNNNFKNPPFIYEDEPDLDSAWSEMRKTLDEKLPVKGNDRSRRRFFYYIRAAAVFLLFLGAMLIGNIYYFNDEKQAELSNKGEAKNITALHNKDEVIGNAALKDTGNKHLNESGDISKSALPTQNILHEKKTFGSFFLQNKSSNADKEEYSLTPQLSEKKDNRKSNYKNQLIFESDIKYSIVKAEANFTDSGITGPQKMLLPLRNAVTSNDTTIKTSETAKNDKQKKKKKLIGFEIGAYYNIGGSLSAIYPIAAITIPLSKKAFLSLGVGLNSQVKINGFAPREFVVLNDTVNQAYFTVEQKNIRKATYIDLPVLFNYKLNKYFTLGAGVQLSVLQNIDMKTEKKTFDFLSNLAQEISSTVFTSNSAYTTYQAYAQEYTVMKTNWRFIAGVGYQFKHAGIKFQYEKSFTSNYSLLDFNGDKSDKRLSVFTVGLTYRIR